MGELDGQACPAGDLEQQVGQVDPGQPGGELGAQGQEAVGFGEPVQRGEDGPVPAGDGLDPAGGVAEQPLRDGPVGGVELAGQRVEFAGAVG